VDELLLRFQIPSREGEILAAADRLLDALARAGFVAPRGAPRLKLALIELVTNAIEHGNRFDERKLVTIEARARADRARVSVADEGPGVPPQVLDRHLDEVALSSKRGRGISLVKRILGARPVLNEARNEVTIEFDRELFQ
jgi:anti-sigma regulatory factor (Ser/Thr protein kinase)